ncbi:MAG: metal ABC transporter substrate-binding protein [Myxococcaceae bacterium]
MTHLFRPLLLALTVLGAAPANATLKVVTTTQDPAAITRAVGGDRVEVKALAKGFQDPHFLDAKPTFMVALNRADLLVCIGLDMEIGYLSALIAGAHNDKLNPGEPGYLDLSGFVTPLEAVPVADRSQGDIHPAGNPHYWLDPENGRLMARGIAARLTQLDPAGKDAYAANLAAFEKTLTAKEVTWDNAMAKLSGQPVITYHRSWSYFARRYKLEVVGFVEPKPGIPPTPQHALGIIRLANSRGVKLQLMENFYDDRMPRLIESKSPAKLAMVPNSVGGTEQVKTYFDLFDTIIGTIVKVTGG